MSASEIDALRRMNDDYPEFANQLIDLRQQELDIHKSIISIEQEEQTMRRKEAPFIRAYAFSGQLMTYSLTVSSLIASIYFAYHNNNLAAGIFAAAISAITSAQFLGKRQSKNKEDEE